jgi:ketopantoate reductase
MNKRVNLIIGSGALGAYLSVELLKKRRKSDRNFTIIK